MTMSLWQVFINVIFCSVTQLFFDSESDSVVIGLEDSPVISGDVKVRFESNSVSTTALRSPLQFEKGQQCKCQQGLGWLQLCGAKSGFVFDFICPPPGDLFGP